MFKYLIAAAVIFILLAVKLTKYVMVAVALGLMLFLIAYNIKKKDKGDRG